MEQYFVSYTVVPTSGVGTKHKQYFVSFTDDLAKIIASIVPTRRRIGQRKLKALLDEYRECGYISLGKPEDFFRVKDIKAKKIPERDMKVLDKYLWPTKG